MPEPTRTFTLNPLQAYTYLVALMSLPGDTLMELGVFSSYQEIIELLQWADEYKEIPEETKGRLYAMFTMPGGDEIRECVELEGIVDPFI